MTEKAQRELYLAIRRACDFNNNSGEHYKNNDSYFLGVLSCELSNLLTAPQFKLNQLEKFSFLSN